MQAKWFPFALALAGTISGLAAQSNSAITTTGQQLTASISGVPGTLPSSATQLLATCSGALTAPSSLAVNVIFVFDTSGSMGTSLAGSGITDFNEDGVIDRIDAAGLGFETLLSFVGGASVDIAVVPFGSSSALLDMSADAGFQNFTIAGTDSDNNGRDDVIDVLKSHDTGGATVFSPVNTGFGTNFDAALTSVNSLVASQPASEPTFVYFLTDGVGFLTNPGGPLDTTIADGTIVTTIGIGPGVATACAPGGSLDIISSATGGTCIFEPDPANLSASLPMTTSTEIMELTLTVNGNVVASQTGNLGLNASGTDDILSFLNLPTNVVECTTVAADGTSVTVSVTVMAGCLVLDFETEDDFTTAIGNGQQITSSGNFGTLVSINGMSANGLNAAAFDTDPAGANASSSDRDLLVDSGNCLILQEVSGQSTAGTYDSPDDDVGGGTLTISFLRASEVCSIDLIDVDDDPNFDQTVVITLTDVGGLTREYTVPPGFTEDIQSQGGTGFRTLDLMSTTPQAGFASSTSVVEDANFDATMVASVTVAFGSSAGIDNLAFIPGTMTVDFPGGLHTVAPGCSMNGVGPVVSSQGGRMPTADRTLTLEVKNLGTTMSLIGVDALQNPVVDLFGAPGCLLGIQGHVVFPLNPGVSGTATLDVPIPAGMDGSIFCVQAFDLNPSANVLGILSSNVVDAVIGR